MSPARGGVGSVPRPDYRAAVANRPVVDLRGEPRTRSELVSQAVLGTPFQVRRERSGWLEVTAPDAYRGWVPAEACVRRGRDDAPYAGRGRVVEVRSNLAPLAPDGRARGPTWTLALGTVLEYAGRSKGTLRVRLPDGRRAGLRPRDAAVRRADRRRPVGSGRAIARFARRFLGIPYLWGGTTPSGFDCSGLVQLCYRQHGVAIPRDADQQFAWGRPVPRARVRPGDLLFFSRESTGITHVGLAIGRGRFLHASGRARGVRTDRIDAPVYRAIFVGARRFLD